MEDHLGWFKLVGLSHYQALINIYQLINPVFGWFFFMDGLDGWDVFRVQGRTFFLSMVLSSWKGCPVSCSVIPIIHGQKYGYRISPFFGYDHGYHGDYCWILLISASWLLSSSGNLYFDAQIHTPKAPATLGVGWHSAEWGGNFWWEVALSKWTVPRKSHPK